jgi:cytochrome c peroxidase
MKKRYLSGILVAAVLFLAGQMAVAGKSSVEYGKELFNDPSLGGSTNETSCNTCHQDGKGLSKAGENPKLSDMINNCITGQLGGQKIDGRSVEMRSLKMYIESLGQ